MRPSAPAHLEVSSVTEDSVTLTWLSPERDGGSRIFKYIIELREGRRGDSWRCIKTVDSSDILVACVEGLREGRPYMFRVHAENSVGAGPPTEVRETVVPKSHMGKLHLLHTHAVLAGVP